MVESSINSANPELKNIYRNKYKKILEIIEEEVDLQDINEKLKELVEPYENNFINEIKEQIILNAQ